MESKTNIPGEQSDDPDAGQKIIDQTGIYLEDVDGPKTDPENINDGGVSETVDQPENDADTGGENQPGDDAGVRIPVSNHDKDRTTTISPSNRELLEQRKRLSRPVQELIVGSGSQEEKWLLAQNPHLEPEFETPLAETGEPVCWELSKRYWPLTESCQMAIIKHGNHDSLWQLSQRQDISEAALFNLLGTDSEIIFGEIVARNDSEELQKNLEKEIKNLTTATVVDFIEKNNDAVVAMVLDQRPDLINSPDIQSMITEKRWRHPDVKEGLCSLSGLRPEVARLVLDHYQKDPIMARKNGDLEAMRSMLRYQEHLPAGVLMALIDDRQLFGSLIDEVQQISPYIEVKIASHKSKRKRRRLAERNYISAVAQRILASDSDKRTRLTMIMNCRNMIAEVQATFVKDRDREIQIAFVSHQVQIDESVQDQILFPSNPNSRSDLSVRRRFAKNCVNLTPESIKSLEADDRLSVTYSLKRNPSLKTQMRHEDEYYDERADQQRRGDYGAGGRRIH